MVCKITVFILGFRQDIGFSSVSISSTTEVKFDLKVMEASTNCFFVVVVGKYLRLMDNVMDIVDNVTEHVGRRPLAVFYMTKDEKITSFYEQPFHLPMVNNLKSINKVWSESQNSDKELNRRELLTQPMRAQITGLMPIILISF